MRHDFDDGKYTVIFDETSGRMSALRYGDEWRDLCGDKLIYSMLSAYDSTSLEVAQLQARVAELEAALAAEFPHAPAMWFESEQLKRESDEYFRGVSDALAFVRGQASI